MLRVRVGGGKSGSQSLTLTHPTIASDPACPPAPCLLACRALRPQVMPEIQAGITPEMIEVLDTFGYCSSKVQFHPTDPTQVSYTESTFLAARTDIWNTLCISQPQNEHKLLNKYARAYLRTLLQLPIAQDTAGKPARRKTASSLSPCGTKPTDDGATINFVGCPPFVVLSGASLS